MTVMDVEALLREMMLEEKCAQLGSAWFSAMLVNGELDDERMESALANGVGQISRLAGGSGLSPERAAAAANRLQRFLKDRTRLGIPAIVHEETLSGLMAAGATQYPQAIGLAATWDPVMVAEVAASIGRQTRDVGGRLALAPVLDVGRDPRWGRLEETFGEEPELISRMGVAYVQGIQAQGVDCCAKHFLGHGGTLGGLNHGEVVTGPRRLRDVDAVPFRAVIHEAGLANVMNAYNDVDGVPVVASHEILTGLLRDELAFSGCVIADYFSIDDLDNLHKIANDRAEAARLALVAGLDVELPASSYYTTLPEQVRNGTLDEELVDRSCRRVLEQKVALGLFDDPFVAAVGGGGLQTAEDRALARRAAARSTVLLTNDGALPLRASSRVAVLGPSTDVTRVFYGDYSYPAHQVHTAGDHVSEPARRGDVDAAILTVREAMAERFDVVDDVADAGCAVVFVGGRSGMSPDDTSGEFRDASDLRLPADQLELIEQVAGSGVPTVVVVIGGRAHSLTEAVPHAGALVMAWLPGDEAARGIVDVLAGEVDAGGRLPVSLLRSVGQVGLHAGHHHGGGRSLIYGDYIDSPVSPLFPFGHGMSYTTWSYDDVTVKAGTTVDDIEIDVTLTNTGDRDGEEVVQVYATDEVASVGVPARRLVAFHRVHVGRGESARLHVVVPAARLGFHGTDLRFRVEPGDVTFHVGPTSTTLALGGDVEHPDPNTVPPFSVHVSA